MADEYGFATTEEEFKALIDELLGKVPDEKTQQANARKALSEIIGIDLDKVEKLINGGQIVFSQEEMFDTTEKNEPSEQGEPESVLAEDLFTAQDPNGLQSTYKAIELPFGTVISIEGDEFLHALIDQPDPTPDTPKPDPKPTPEQPTPNPDPKPTPDPSTPPVTPPAPTPTPEPSQPSTPEKPKPEKPAPAPEPKETPKETPSQPKPSTPATPDKPGNSTPEHKGAITGLAQTGASDTGLMIAGATALVTAGGIAMLLRRRQNNN